MKAVKCACCGGPTKRNGRTSVGGAEMEMRRVRRFGHRALRRRGRPPRGVPVGWLLSKGTQARDAGRRPDLQAQDLGVLGGLAHARARRASSTGSSSSTGSGSRERLRRADLPAARIGWSRGTWRNPRRLEGVVGAHGARSPAPDVVVTDGGSGFAKAVRGRPGPGPRSRDACSTRSARSKGARRQGQSFRRAGSCTGSRSTSCISRRCTRRSCGASATSTGAASGPTSSRTPRSSTGGGSTPTRGSGRRGGRCPRWSRRGRSSPTSTPGSRKAGPLPSTNNRIEGGVNAQLRAVLRNHRGLTSLKRVKAVFWWCHAHSGDARTAREKLATMPRDADIDLLYEVYSSSPKQGDGRPEWGDRAVWEELHRKDPFPFWLD